MIVVTSAGNAGDTYFIGGSPGSASRAIATAASVDDGLAGGALQVNAPPAIAADFLAAAADLHPDPAPAPSGQTANVVLAIDGARAGSGTVNDGCQRSHQRGRDGRQDRARRSRHLRLHQSR